jgi:hypothetical protein
VTSPLLPDKSAKQICRFALSLGVILSEDWFQAVVLSVDPDANIVSTVHVVRKSNRELISNVTSPALACKGESIHVIWGNPFALPAAARIHVHAVETLSARAVTHARYTHTPARSAASLDRELHLLRCERIAVQRQYVRAPCVAGEIKAPVIAIVTGRIVKCLKCH